MRRTASEIIRQLETRIAHLERQAMLPSQSMGGWNWLDTRRAIGQSSIPKVEGFVFKEGGSRHRVGEWRPTKESSRQVVIGVSVDNLPNGNTTFDFSLNGRKFYSSVWKVTDTESAKKNFHMASVLALTNLHKVR